MISYYTKDKYDILYGPSRTELLNKLADAQRDGWSPFGNPFDSSEYGLCWVIMKKEITVTSIHPISLIRENDYNEPV